MTAKEENTWLLIAFAISVGIAKWVFWPALCAVLQGRVPS